MKSLKLRVLSNIDNTICVSTQSSVAYVRTTRTMLLKSRITFQLTVNVYTAALALLFAKHYMKLKIVFISLIVTSLQISMIQNVVH